MKRLLLALLLLGVSLFVGCGGSSSSSGGGGNPVTLVSIAVTPASSSVNVGATQQFAATGTYSDGSTKVLTATANWISVTASVATVNASGLVSGVAVGTSSITASSNGGVGSTTLTVANPLVSIAVTPPTVTLAPVAQQQFTATGKYTDGTTQNITSTVTWASSAPRVAAINSAGLAVAVAPGTTTISATLGTVSGTAALTVSPALVSIAVTPATATVAPNGTQQFIATGAYSDGSHKVITSTVTWAATATSATITAGGLATGITPGSTSTITATQNGIVSNSATLTVTNPLVSIAVTPPTSSVAPNGTQQFTASGTFADQSTKVLTSGVTWKATAGATITAGGLATGVTPKTTSTITATSGTISGTATLTVTNPLISIAVAPTTASVAPNSTQQFTATGTYADHSTQNLTSSVTWSASVGAIITAGGLATGVTPNTTSTILATQGSIVSNSAVLTITNPLVSITVSPSTASIAPGTTQQFTATPTYADGTHFPAITPTWTSSNTSVATISNAQGTQGLASGLTAGSTSITAALGSITSLPAALTVTSASLVSIAVTPAAPAIVLQTQQQFTATGTFSDQSTQDITNTVTWSTSDITKITITPSGVGGGLATGVGTTSSPVTILATKGNVNGSTTATVIPPTVISIAITATTSASDPTKLAVGTSRRYKATATLQNGGTLNVTSLGSWSSSNQGIATVNAGLVTGVSAGPVAISVTYPQQNGVTQTLNLTVTNVTVSSITVTPIASIIPVGVLQPFFATATFSDSTTQDVSSTASWNSSNTTFATVNSVGIASSLSPGTATITATFPPVGGQSGAAQLTVDTATLQSISVTPSQTILAPGSSVNYQASGHYSDGSAQFISSLVTWASSAPSVVSILPGGTATGLSAGTANITATYQNVTSNTAGVAVTSSPLASIAVTPSPATIPEGVSLQFTAIGTFIDQSTQNLTTNVTWASSQPSVANIGNVVGQQGLATGGVSPGQTSITAVFAGVVSNPAAILTVTNATITSIAVAPHSPSVNHGATLPLAATGTFSDSSQINLTAQVVWTSSDATKATISGSGLVSGVSPGTTTITATFTQLTQSGPVVVNDIVTLTVN